MNADQEGLLTSYQIPKRKADPSDTRAYLTWRGSAFSADGSGLRGVGALSTAGVRPVESPTAFKPFA